MVLAMVYIDFLVQLSPLAQRLVFYRLSFTWEDLDSLYPWSISAISISYPLLLLVKPVHIYLPNKLTDQRSP